MVGVEVSKKTANHGAGDDVLVFACQDPGLKVFEDPGVTMTFHENDQ